MPNKFAALHWGERSWELAKAVRKKIRARKKKASEINFGGFLHKSRVVTAVLKFEPWVESWILRKLWSPPVTLGFWINKRHSSLERRPPMGCSFERFLSWALAVWKEMLLVQSWAHAAKIGIAILIAIFCKRIRNIYAINEQFRNLYAINCGGGRSANLVFSVTSF